MSASSKKKLRNAEQAEKLTEKQLAEQKEAKKLKLYTTLAVVILIALVVFAAYTGITRVVTNSGIRERNTVALTIGEDKINNAELNYFFMDAVNQFYNQYGSYAALLGLDISKPLDEQIFNEETSETWADNFMNSAIQNARMTYALANEAKANGFTLPEAAVSSIDQSMSTMELYASMYGYPSTEAYVKAMYGNGASAKSLRAYFELTSLANAYQTDYYNSLTYEDAELRAAEAENFDKYSSYSYNYYYLSTTNFVEGEKGEVGYTAEQMAAAAKNAEAAAKSLTEGITTVEAFDKAVAALSIDAEYAAAASFASNDVIYGNISSIYADWITDASRKAGDMTYVANTTVSTDENGNETEQISGYYVLMFNSKNDNTFALANVRHILVDFEGGSYDSTTGITTYSDEEKATAKAAADEIYNEWKNGAATEESFAALANEKSDDGDGTTGGLVENVYPGRTVPNFENWCFGDRKIGDTDIVESEYGYHIMFYCGDSETTYRDYLISNELASADYSDWHTALVEAVSVTEENTKFVRTDIVLGS